MGLLQAGSRWLRELRKWSLAPLGAVLAVILLGAGVTAFIATGGDPSPEELIRKYFASQAGGGAPPDQARRIEVNDCQPTNQFARGEFIYKCNVVFGDKGYVGCFAWNRDGVVAGSRELGDTAGCRPLFWSRGAGSLVTPEFH